MSMKSPDETKKWLADPIPVHYHPGDREPRLTPLAMVDLERLHSNALALIQQLEAQNAELLKKVEMLAERDEELKAIKEGCFTCKHSYMNNPGIEICPYVTKCDVSDSHWEWRGPQKENH